LPSRPPPIILPSRVVGMIRHGLLTKAVLLPQCFPGRLCCSEFVSVVLLLLYFVFGVPIRVRRRRISRIRSF
jgi:hypothetical protein